MKLKIFYNTSNLSLILMILSGAVAHALSFHANLGSIKVTVDPGQSVSTHFRLTLTSDQPATEFHLRTQDFYRSEDGVQSFYKSPGTLAHSCATWLAINPVDTTVQSGGALDARLTINVPTDVKPGGYWCVLTVDELPNPLSVTPQGVGMKFLTSISVGVFVSVEPITKSARIEGLEFGHGSATVTLGNTGDCPFSATGHIDFLQQGAEVPVATVDLPKAAVFCEPIPTALITAPLPDPKTLPDGTYTARVVLDIGLDHYIGAQKTMVLSRTHASPTP